MKEFRARKFAGLFLAASSLLILCVRNFSASLEMVKFSETASEDLATWFFGPPTSKVIHETTLAFQENQPKLFSTPEHATKRFHILDAPEMSTWLIGNRSSDAVQFYDQCLNEEAIEVWLHRGFEQFSVSRTLDPTLADVFFIPYYGHFGIGNLEKPKPEVFANLLINERIYNKSKPHILLCPSNNPGRSREAGIPGLVKTLIRGGVNLWSVGIERNPSWQTVNASRIIPIPYLVKPSGSISDLKHTAQQERVDGSVFYAGDFRPNAVTWGGCNRSMVEPLVAVPKMTIHLIKKKEDRLNQSIYDDYVKTMEFCLILCGDTPTSRAMAASVVYGCIPVRVGSRLRGLCEKPCKKGFGWKINGPKWPHLPYANLIPWSEFPEVVESDFINDPNATLQKMMTLYPLRRKRKLRAILQRVQLGWIYGWDSPVKSDKFGRAVEYIWNSALFIIFDIPS